jgi:lipopolysaccharide transport system ATP-binding protein
VNKTQTHNQQPTVFHITHWKAGSQWLHRILLELTPERIVSPQIDEKQFLQTPLVRGAVYPTVYVTKEHFHSVALPANYRKFVIIRDLRDTLVSGYFSIRYSHALIDERLVRWRERLEAMTIEEGLLMLMDEWLPMSARIQNSWIEAGEKCIRYEALLEKDSEILEELLIGHCEIPVAPERLREIVVANRFENVTGRKLGEENLMAHERKGVAGDWRNHFTKRVKEVFKMRYGGLLVATGYERDLNW